MIKQLCEMIRKDKQVFYGYQSSIAKCFYDAFERHPKRYKTLDDAQAIANEAAVEFLNNLIKE